ncbi:MAG TPA: UDP-N-acetylmuramate--L-alanine ligase [Actinocrinis sp.]|nr:UDP-N-acetylmuramate--L-alanine ligase [Actinocrinis sp.]
MSTPIYQLLDPKIPAEELGRIHFVGVGGVGMAPVARIAAQRGLPVSGSEHKSTPALADLARAGVRVFAGHDPAQLDGVDTVVTSSGVPPGNVELVEARRRGLRLVHRATALAALMVGHTAVLVAGTHGKTTTTSLLAVALEELGADPSYAIGGEIGRSGVSGQSGKGPVFVAEADESDGSFTHYSPDLAVITNVELDHTDYFASIEAVHEAFLRFADRIKPGGTLLVCADEPGAALVAERFREREQAAGGDRRVVGYGRSEQADYRFGELTLADGCARFQVTGRDGAGHRVELAVPGVHNAENATAAFAVLAELGFDPALIPASFAQFTGTRRRMELKGQAAGVRVYDDYMHHPTEIAVTLAAYRGLLAPGGPAGPDGPGRAGRLLVAFQPQRYSRAQTFLRQYGPPLGAADAVVVLEVYPGSGEDPIPGVTGAVVARDVPLPPELAVFEPVAAAAAARLAGWARPGDVIVTAGAGDVTTLGPAVLDLLRAREETVDS